MCGHVCETYVGVWVYISMHTCGGHRMLVGLFYLPSFYCFEPGVLLTLEVGWWLASSVTLLSLTPQHSHACPEQHCPSNDSRRQNEPNHPSVHEEPGCESNTRSNPLTMRLCPPVWGRTCVCKTSLSVCPPVRGAPVCVGQV